MIRLLLVDDHPVVRAGLRGMFAAEPGIDVVGEASSAAWPAAAARAHQPDVVLMDLRMPDGDGAQATTLVLAERPQCRVVILDHLRQRCRHLARGQGGRPVTCSRTLPTRNSCTRSVPRRAAGPCSPHPWGPSWCPGCAPRLDCRRAKSRCFAWSASVIRTPRWPRPVHKRGHGEDTSAEGVRQAGRVWPGGRRDRRP